jgi:hypothetical protein
LDILEPREATCKEIIAIKAMDVILEDLKVLNF